MVNRLRHPTSKAVPMPMPPTSSTTNNIRITSWTVYAQPFTSQPWKFLWWVDDKAHRLLPPRLARRLFGRLCDHLDRKLWT